MLLSGVMRRSGVLNTARRGLAGSAGNGKLHEVHAGPCQLTPAHPILNHLTANVDCRQLRQYVLKTECLPNYLALTGSDAFKPRTDASPLLGFFLVETGWSLHGLLRCVV